MQIITAQTIDEAIDLADRSGRPVRFAHATFMPKRPYQPMPDTLRKRLREIAASHLSNL